MNIRFFTLVLCAMLIIGVGAHPLTAQTDIPLGAPLLALDTAEQDRIVLVDITTGATRDLQFGAGWHRVWGFSPDGCRILFTLNHNGASSPSRAYTARLDGSDLRELVTFASPPAGEWGVWEPQWSPNMSDPRIAFTFIRYDTPYVSGRALQYRIGWVRPEGGEPNFYSVTGDEHTARWSPNGERLVYVSYEQRQAGDITLREADLWLVNADGTNKIRLTNFPDGNVSMPRWSPDNDLIGFVYSPSANNDQLWMIGAQAETIPTQLSYATALALDLTWMTDSSALVAAMRDLRGLAQNRLWRIPLVGVADNDATQLISDPTVSYLDYPRFSADGQYLAFRTAYALGLVELQNGTFLLLDDRLMGNTPPVWSPSAYLGEGNCS